MSSRHWTGLLIVLGAALCPSAGYAQGIGMDEKIHSIQPTKDPEYNLAYKTSTLFIIAGCYIHDDGYVLQKVGESDKYIPLDDATIQKLQQEGSLPTPLPPYSLSFWDYLFGYSNWIIMAFLIGIPLIAWAVRKAREPRLDP